jgi:uncharacterized protein YegP (UPF0339 family)
VSRQARFEIVRTDAGWHGRFRAANGRIVWSTEVYTRKASLHNAIDSFVRALSPTNQVWIDEGPWTPDVRASVRMGYPGGSMFSTAKAIPVRLIDERKP